jgi:D-alanyl-lipoteichoic acid acyltransferase DltB (MBOAT superfamily)
MAFTSPSFLLLLLAFVLLTNAFPSPRARSVTLCLASAVFIGSYVDSALQLLPLAAFLAFGYASIELLRRGRSRGLLAVLLVGLLGGFVVLKRYSFLGPAVQLPFPYLMVGLSYVLFRLIHLMVDAQQGELGTRIPALQFVNYCLSFLTFTAGPIQLYPEFASEQQARPVQDPARVGTALARVVRGFVKVGVASAILNYVFVALSGRLLSNGSLGTSGTWALFGASAVTYTAYLYSNFAGYMDIVLGVGELAGQRLPENFNQPFAARSFLDFWSRWHMTLSNWFKVYLFNPLLKGLAKRYPSNGSAAYLAAAAFFVTFLVMGLWHGTTAVFVIYGLLLGAGASINKGWQVFASARFGKRANKQAGERPLAVYAARGLTFAYFALALSCLWLDLPQLLGLARRLGPGGLVASYGALTLGAALVFASWDAASARLRTARARLSPLFGSPLSRDFALAAQILLVLSVGSFFHKAPEFVYRAF